MKKRIALFTNRYPASDQDTASPFVSDFCRALVALGVDLRVLTPYYPPGGVERDPWVERFRWAESDQVMGQLSVWRPHHLLKLIRAVTCGRRAAMDLARAFRPEFVFALWALPSGFWAQRVSRELRVPFGVWCLGSDVQLWGRRPVGRQLVRSILRSATLRYADGPALALETERLAERPCGFLPSLRLVHSVQARDTRHPLEGKRYFLYLGRVTRDKGVDDLLDAVAQLPPNKDITTVIAGSPAKDFDVEAHIRSRNLHSRCRFVGPVTACELSTYLKHAEAVVLPSHRDSIPLVFGEAMQAGTPVICSDLPDFEAILRRYRVGVTFPVGDTEALARTLATFKAQVEWKTDMVRFVHDCSPAAAAGKLLNDLATKGEWVPAAPEGGEVMEAVHG